MTRLPEPAAIDRDALLELVSGLVRIESVNPEIEAGGGGEGRIAAWLADRLREMGLGVDVHEAAPGRPSVVGRLRGAGGGRSLMLNAHLDTVGVAGMADPFAATVSDGRLYGRGAFDMKGSLAACVAAVGSIRAARIPLAGDVVIAAVADEEHASLGTRDVLRRIRVDGAIVTEPTSLRICRAHKGFVWIEIETLGRAAHGSRFDLGIDANLAMGRVLVELAALERELRGREPHPLVGPPSLHAATLEGGSGLSTYASSCVLRVERRTVPGESLDRVLEEMRAVLARAADGEPELRTEMRVLMSREPFEVAPEGRLVRSLQRAARATLGTETPHAGQSFWMDAALLSAAGIETVVFGPSGEGAHAVEEWVDIDSLVSLAGTLARAAVDYCGVAP
jgi:acetylornithine deacetylase